MILGNFQFSLKTLSPQTLSRKTEYNWPDSERIGDLPNLQNLGISKDEIEIAGVFYPKLHGDVSWSNISSSHKTISYASIADIRNSDLCRIANNLINDSGEILGRFVIISISETQSFFDKSGIPQKIEFTLMLKRSPGDTNAIINLGNGSSVVGSATNLARSYLRW